VLLCGLLALGALGHGHLAVPTTRDIVQNIRVDLQNAPTGWNTDFVCRGLAAGTPQVTLTAGEALTVQWSMSAAHVGDCFFYLSYDANLPDAQKTWFKIAQIANCNTLNNMDQTITIPSYIPSCSNCILRWEWYALQQVTNTEFYAQCVDVAINGVAGGVLGTPRVTVPGNLPADNQNMLNYRLAFNPGSPFFFTGPAVAVADNGATTSTSTTAMTTTTAAPTTSKATTAAPTTARVTTAAPTTARVTTAAPTSAAATGTCGADGSRVWLQCGGQEYSGSTCCGYDAEFGQTSCTVLSVWYSQCDPVTARLSTSEPATKSSVGVAVSLGAVGGFAAVGGVVLFRRRKQRQQQMKINLLDVEVATKF